MLFSDMAGVMLLIVGVSGQTCGLQSCAEEIQQHTSTSLLHFSASLSPTSCLEPGEENTPKSNASNPFFEVVKYTVAVERNPLQALTFALRYLKMEPREDTPAGNMASCPRGDVIAGRPDFVPEGAGTCVIITSGAGSVVASNVSDVSISLNEEPLSECGYDEGKTISLDENSVSYHVSVTGKEKCCLACQADQDCLGSNYVPGKVEQNFGFGFHMPASRSRLIHTSYTVADIEEIVESKIGGMTEFDAWMDFNIGVFTNDMDAFLETLETDGVLYFPAKWPLGGLTMYSLFVNVPTTQATMEVMGLNSRKLEGREIRQLEQRVPESRMLKVFEEAKNKDALLPVRISRAATDLESIERFYGQGLQLKRHLSVNEGNVSVRCYEWSSGQPLVCFTKRPDSATKGFFKVGNFEDMLYENAQIMTKNALCNANRWFDNHYSVQKQTDDSIPPSWHNYIVDFVDANPEIPHNCNPDSGLYYLSDPTGWAVQFPSGIGSRLPLSCGGGHITPGVYKNTSLSFVFCDLGDCEGVDLLE